MRFVSKHLGGSPYSIPGLKHDLNLLNHVKSVTKNGANRISQINDDSGQNNHATQGTQNEQPILIFNAINGKPAARFDGIGDALNLISVLPNSGDFTMYLVLSIPNAITSATNTESWLSKQTATLPRSGLNAGAVIPTPIGETLMLTHVNGVSLPSAYIKDIIPAGLNIIKIKLSGSTTTISINSVAKTVFIFDGGLSSSKSLTNIDRIGANIIGLGGASFVGDMGRFLYYDRTLTGNDNSGEDGFLTDFLIKEWA